MVRGHPSTMMRVSMSLKGDCLGDAKRRIRLLRDLLVQPKKWRRERLSRAP